MKIIEVVVSRSEKVNTGNYESKDYFVSLKAEVEYDADLKAVTSKLFAQCWFILNEEIKKVKGDSK